MKFNEKVYNITKKIPKGKVTTYKIIAEKLKTKAYRAIGNALKNNKKPIIIPCHRVINSDGKIGGYMGKTSGKSLKRKINLLKKEGVKIKNKKIVDFYKVLYKFQDSRFIIKKPKASDFNDIFNLLKQLWPGRKIDKKKLRKIFLDILNSKNEYNLIGLYNGRIVGFITFSLKSSLYVMGNMAYIHQLVVDKRLRNYGFGTMLLEETISIASKKGCIHVELDSALHRKKSHNFYKKKGFRTRSIHFSKSLKKK